MRNPNNTVYDAKRLIGRVYGDPNVSKDMFHWPFGVASENGKPVIQVYLLILNIVKYYCVCSDRLS